MRDPLCVPKQAAVPALSSHDEKGIFIPTSAKFYAVTAALWLSMLALCATSWVGAWVIGVKIARLLGAL